MRQPVRPPAVAGSFYPQDPQRLAAEVKALLAAALPPFVEVRVVDVTPVASGWSAQEGAPAFAWPVARGRTALAVLDPLAPHRWLAEIDDTLHLVEAGTGSADLPRVSLAEPLERWAVVPDEGRWREGVARYRRRVVLVLGEGVLFVAAMVSVPRSVEAKSSPARFRLSASSSSRSTIGSTAWPGSTSISARRTPTAGWRSPA